MAISINTSYRFGEFRLDAHDQTLWRGEELIPLQPKVFEVLNFLIERSGQVVSKAELMNSIWAETFVEEGNLTQSIYQLRRALGTDQDGRQFIETIPRRGYRFVIPAKLISEACARQFSDPNSIVEGDALPNIEITQEDSATNKQLSSTASFHVKRENAIAQLPTRYRWFLFGILAVAALAGLIGFRPFPIQNNKSAESPIENVSIQKLTSSGDSAYHVVAPDGKSIAYVRETSLYVQDVESGKASRLDISGADVFGFIKFSGDGQLLYYRNQYSTDLPGVVFRVSRFGGQPTPVFDQVWGAFSFSPDEKRAAFFRFDPATNQHTLIIKTLDSGEEAVLLTRQPPESFHNVGQPAWSADGRLLAVTTKSPRSPASQIVVTDVDNKTSQALSVSRLIQISHLAWMPDGKSLIASAREKERLFQLWRINFPDGDISRLTNDLNFYAGGSLSADGKLLVASQYSNFSHIWTASIDRLEDQRQITFGNQNKDGINGIAWTPDKNIVYVTRTTGDFDLWLLRTGDGSRQRLTQNSSFTNVNPVTSYDGKYIYFNSTRNQGSHIWRTDINGENPTQLTFGDHETEHFPNISPDGNWLYYVQRGPKSSGIWRKSLVDGTTQKLTAPETAVPNNFLTLSPDGKLLAFHNLTKTIEEAAQILQVGVISAEGSSEPRFYNIRARRSIVRWSSDSKSFDYIENRHDCSKLWRHPLDSNVPPTLLLSLSDNGINNFAWSPDGKQLALARGQDQNDAVLLTNF